jgi:hypothetical protein
LLTREASTSAAMLTLLLLLLLLLLLPLLHFRSGPLAVC